MRKTFWMLTVVVLCGLSFLALAPPELLAQWGVIQRGVEATKPARREPANRPGAGQPRGPIEPGQDGRDLSRPP